VELESRAQQYTRIQLRRISRAMDRGQEQHAAAGEKRA
jgi:hypothetical protein